MTQQMVEVWPATKKYLTTWNFRGRSSRSEYWWPVLVSFLVSFIPYVNFIFGLYCIVPSICVCVRRLHDIGKSGWWYWLGLIPVIGWIMMLVWFCSKSEDQANAYGPVPNTVGPEPARLEA